MKVTNKYNKYVLNIKLEHNWKYLYSSHLEVAILQPWKQLPEHFNFLNTFLLKTTRKNNIRWRFH